MDPLSRMVTLLILTSQMEDAEGLIKSLRKGGLTVRGVFTSESERMGQLLSTNPFELILCCEYDPAIALNTCMRHYRELGTDVPLVIIARGAIRSSVLIDALRSGAKDLTEHGDIDHLQLVVARELANLGHRRAEDLLRKRLAECERRSRDPIDAPGEAGTRVVAEMPTSVGTGSRPENLDADTGLPNRAALLEELDTRLAVTDAEHEPFAAIYVGIRVFHELLQHRGLTSGLKAAATIGTALRDLVPKQTYLARVGDDGYILLAPNIGRAEAAALAATISEKIRLPLHGELDSDDIPQCGTGVLLSSGRTRSGADLLDSVFRDYVSSMHDQLPEPDPSEISEAAEEDTDESARQQERRFAAHIGHALDANSLQLVYQPIISLKGDSQESYSVLVRLREDDRTLREAKDFLNAASRSGQMVAVDRWVIRKAIAEVASQRVHGEKINFFVNVGEETVQEEKLLIWICDCLREFQARGNWLTFQVQEDHARRHAAVFFRLREGLRKVRCRVALNRFGEGPNPDLLLRSLRVDYVKFVPELGQDLGDDVSKRQRLQELTKLAHEAGVKSVVTGVEDARSLTLIWTAGIDYVQGNFLQKPSMSIGTT